MFFKLHPSQILVFVQFYLETFKKSAQSAVEYTDCFSAEE